MEQKNCIQLVVSRDSEEQAIDNVPHSKTESTIAGNGVRLSSSGGLDLFGSLAEKLTRQKSTVNKSGIPNIQGARSFLVTELPDESL